MDYEDYQESESLQYHEPNLEKEENKEIKNHLLFSEGGDEHHVDHVPSIPSVSYNSNNQNMVNIQKSTLFESLFSSIVLFFTYPFSFSIKSLIILTILLLILFVVFVTYEFYQTKLETTIHVDKIIRNHSFLPKYILDKNGKCYYVGDYLFSLLKEEDYERWKEDYQYKVLCIGHSFDLRIIQVFDEIEPPKETLKEDEDSSLNTIKNLFGAI